MGEELRIAEYVLTEDVSRDAAVLRLGGEALYLFRGHPFWGLVDLLFEVRAPIRLRVQMDWVDRLKAHPQAELRQASSEVGQPACCLADFAAFTPILGDQITLTDRGGQMESVLIGLPATTLIDVLTLPRVRVPFLSSEGFSRILVQAVHPGLANTPTLEVLATGKNSRIELDPEALMLLGFAPFLRPATA